jgi:hypothetical protein
LIFGLTCFLDGALPFQALFIQDYPLCTLLNQDSILKITALLRMETKKSEEKQEFTPDSSVAASDNENKYPSGWAFALIILSLWLGTLLVAIDNTVIGKFKPRATPYNC